MSAPAPENNRKSHTFAIGVDYGTSSVRAVIVDTSTGEEISTAIWAYPHGTDGIITDDRDPNVARQHPGDYFNGFRHAVREAVRSAPRTSGFAPDRVVGLGVDTTGSTPVPVNRRGIPLGMLPEFAGEVDALAWLWKDHTAHAEASEISRLAIEANLPYLAKCGGAYSSEWYWSKMLRCERISPRIAQAAYGWVECCDLIPGYLTGQTDPDTMSRGICAAGHKGLYHESWNGLPSPEFLESLSPGFSRYRSRFKAPAVTGDHRTGGLMPEIASAVGLPAGIPVAAGSIDAHVGAVGAGVGPGTLVKIIGTSTCDCMVAPLLPGLPDIQGVCGIVPGSILPGMYGVEAGQSAVGDIFNWFARHVSECGRETPIEAMERLTKDAAMLRPGESGLVALDWHNGNRTVLVDPRLTGLVVGQTLRTTQAEVFRALIEATAFGALKIIDRIGEYGVAIDRVVNCGGIAEKSPLVMQIYADVCGRPMMVSRSSQTCALGAAIFGAVVGGAHPDVQAAQRAMTGVRDVVYRPNAGAVSTYRELYSVYTMLHDAFGIPGRGSGLDSVMKKLIEIRERVRSR